MTPLQAVLILEGATQAEDEDEYIAAAQYLIDNGIHLHLQGSLQRVIIQMVEWGLCTLPE